MRSWNSERGMSLVEATIILMVLAILTSVLAPSIGDYVNDARQVKAKEDLEALGHERRSTGSRHGPAVPGSHGRRRAVEGVHQSRGPAGLGRTASDDHGRHRRRRSRGGLPDSERVEWNDAVGVEVELATEHLVTNVERLHGGDLPGAGGPECRAGLARWLPEQLHRPRSVGRALRVRDGVAEPRVRRDGRRPTRAPTTTPSASRPAPTATSTPTSRAA